MEGVEKGGVWYSDSDTVTVELDLDALLEFNISIDEVKQALNKTKYNDSYQALRSDPSKISYEIINKNNSLQELAHTIIKIEDKRIFKLEDIANISLNKDKSFLLFQNGRPSLNIYASFASGANIASSCRKIDAVIEQLKNIDPDIEIKSIINPADEINNAISSLTNAILISILVASLCIYFFSLLL